MARYQNGCLTEAIRKNGMAVWVFRWNDRGIDGSIKPRKKVLGPVKDLPANGKQLRVNLDRMRLLINSESNPLRTVTVDALVHHFKETELVDKGDDGRAYSTRDRYASYINKWILPRWAKYDIKNVNAVEIEAWLKSLDLANGSKAKIRDVMSVLFAHANRQRWIEGDNPVKAVRQSGKREFIPDILTAEEMQKLLSVLDIRERAMVFLDMATALRRGELKGLKWGDVDFDNHQISVTRSVVDQQVGPCKTEASRKAVPMNSFVAAELRTWWNITAYRKPEDWVWATDSNRAGKKRGKQPLWLSKVMQYHIQPKALAVGIIKKVSWHTFRHTFSTLLKSTGEDVKVVQELLRHATSRITMDTYTQALTHDKREAQSKVVNMFRVQ